MSRLPGGAVVLFALGSIAWIARPAQADEAWLLQGEAAAGASFNDPARALFGPGGSLAVSAYRSLAPPFLAGLRLRAAGFADADSNDASRADPGAGGIASMLLAGRLRPFSRTDGASRATGLWLELAGGGGFTGKNLRPMAEVGFGFGFATASVVLGPTLRYMQIVQAGSGRAGTDAKIGLLGIEVTWFDPQPAPPPPPPWAPLEPPPPPDTDGDGVRDPDDRCPTDPEDKDDFEDDDGCPDRRQRSRRHTRHGRSLPERARDGQRGR